MKEKLKSWGPLVFGLVFAFTILYWQDRLESIIGLLPGQSVWASIPILIGMTIAIVWWTIKHHQPRKSSEKSIGRRIPAAIIVFGFSYFLIAMSDQSACAQEVQVGAQVVTQSQPLTYQDSGCLIIDGQQQMMTIESAKQNPMLRDSIELMQKNGLKNYTVERAVSSCDVKILVLLVFVGAMVIVTIKVIQACNNIQKKRQKRLDDADGDGSTNQNRSALQSLRNFAQDTTNLAAFFSSGYEFMTNIVDDDMYVDVPFVGRGEITQTGSAVPSSRLSTTTVDFATLLTSYGLVTNGANSFSVNGVATNSLAEITYNASTRLTSINLSNRQNITVTIQCTTDLANWENVMRISLPVGVIFDFQDAYSPVTPKKFWRFIREQ